MALCGKRHLLHLPPDLTDIQTFIRANRSWINTGASIGDLMSPPEILPSDISFALCKASIRGTQRNQNEIILKSGQKNCHKEISQLVVDGVAFMEVLAPELVVCALICDIGSGYILVFWYRSQ